MRVLVTGGTGFVGSHVSRQLLAAGHQVRLLVRSPDKAQQLYAELACDALDIVAGDICDGVSVRNALQNCNALVHAAAATPITANSAQQLMAINADGTRTVMDAALAEGLDSIVYISSITTIFNTDAAKVNPEQPLASSRLPYGQSKIAAENYVRSLQQRVEGISIVYPGGIIGPDDPGFSDTFKALKHRIENGFRIFGDGGMQHIDVRDLAAFIVSLAVEGGSGRFPVPGVYIRWAQLADLLDELRGTPLQRIPAQGWKLRLVGRVMDVVRLFKPVDTPISYETMRYATQWPEIANSEALTERGIHLRSARETFADSLSWMLAAGHLQADQVPKLAASSTEEEK